MHSPLDNTELETFFGRLNAPLRAMPPQERAELHLEVRQHLDGLTAAYEELGLSHEEALASALRSFGDPRRFGRRMCWEWRRSRWCGVSDEMRAVVTMIGLLLILVPVVLLMTLNLCLWVPYLFRHWTPEAGRLLYVLELVWVPARAGSILGRKRPKHAVAGAFYGTVALASLPLLTGLVSLPWTRDFSPFGNIALWAGCWLGSGCGAAYMSSRRRAGQQRLRLAGLRLKARNRL